jgi:hypothetical protein
LEAGDHRFDRCPAPKANAYSEALRVRMIEVLVDENVNRAVHGSYRGFLRLHQSDKR